MDWRKKVGGNRFQAKTRRLYGGKKRRMDLRLGLKKSEDEALGDYWWSLWAMRIDWLGIRLMSSHLVLGVKVTDEQRKEASE